MRGVFRGSPYFRCFLRVFMRSFRAGGSRRFSDAFAGIKNVASPRWHGACGSPSRRSADFEGTAFFDKSPSLVPSLTDLHLFEPRPSKRRTKNWTPGRDSRGSEREFRRHVGLFGAMVNGRKRRSIIISSSLMRWKRQRGERRRKEGGESAFIVVVGQAPRELKETRNDTTTRE